MGDAKASKSFPRLGGLEDLFRQSRRMPSRMGQLMLPKDAVNDNRVLTLIDTLSDALSNIDAVFEHEVVRVQSMAKPELGLVILSTVRQRHTRCGEPYVQQIARPRK
jgi:hypothetical protein